MSDMLKHECGIAVLRLRKPLSYYYQTYGTHLWGLRKLFLLMEKQHNRGQDGVGIGAIKQKMPLGSPYAFRRRDASKDSLSRVFAKEWKSFGKMKRKGVIDCEDVTSVKRHFDFSAEILMGHLRYGTSGEFSAGSCHPYLRRSNWPTRTLMVMGNFNMTNTRELNERLIERGQHPVFGTDTQTVLEELGFYLDEAHTDLYRSLRDEGRVDGREIPEHISHNLNLPHILSSAAKHWDGGYAIAGAIGNGDLFVMRDPSGIRPCYAYEDDEVIAFASERVPLMTIFEASEDQVHPVEPGIAHIINHQGDYTQCCFHAPLEQKPCSFERIYFSRGNDPDIYRERQAMGGALVNQVVDAIGGDFDKAVFSFVPNTAEIAYYGLLDGVRQRRRQLVKSTIMEALAKGALDEPLLDSLIMHNWPRAQKVVHKDIKMRTFISQESGRDQLVSHVYDITYGQVKADDALVVLDDSIVRGTTLKTSILKILARTQPHKIVICSTAPQIRYPDCYGIDMSELGKFIAFQALVSLLKKDGKAGLLEETYQACLKELKKVASQRRNPVKLLYDHYTQEEISHEISRMVTPQTEHWQGDVEVIFQTIDNLHACIEGPCGDWYFTGNYPTQGGYTVVNIAFVKWFEGCDGRSYDLPL